VSKELLAQNLPQQGSDSWLDSVAMITIRYHAFKAAVSNPVKALRTE